MTTSLKRALAGALLCASMLPGAARAAKLYCQFDFYEYVGDTFVTTVKVYEVDWDSVEIWIAFNAPTCSFPAILDHTISAQVNFSDGGWIYTGDIETDGVSPQIYTNHEYVLDADCVSAQVEVDESCGW